MSKPYYTLLMWHSPVYGNDAQGRHGVVTAGYWAAEFGDYQRAVVAQELEDISDSEMKPKRMFKIVRTGDRQVDIDAAIVKANRPY